MKHAVIGSGNVGTSIATAAAAAGHDVTVADVDQDALDARAAKVDRAATTTDTAAAARDADVVALAVPAAEPSAQATPHTHLATWRFLP